MNLRLTSNPLLATLTGVIVLTIFGILGYFITRPYIQYDEGPFYKTGNVAVGSLRLENKGYFDAEQINIEAAFKEPLTDITSDKVSPFTVTSGGKGFKTVVGSITRISPSQSVYIYFAIDNSSGIVGDGWYGVVRQITYKNGVGSTEPPLWNFWGLVFIGSIAIGLVWGWFYRFIQRSRANSKELKEAKEGLITISDRIEQINQSMRKTISEDKE